MLVRILTRQNIAALSKHKNEPEWVLNFRLKGLQVFKQMSYPNWGPNLQKIKQAIKNKEVIYFSDVAVKPWASWEQIPQKLKTFFEKIKIPEAEKKFLAGVELQYDSSTIYTQIKAYLEKLGVIFTNIDTAIQEYPELVKKYLGKAVLPADNKFAALNSAVFSGGSFVYVPEGVHVKLPLHAFFYINHPGLAQFERSLIILEEGAKLEYLEGCSAPLFSKNNLHAAVVEIFVGKNATMSYTTLQNWSKNVFNLTTQRAIVQEKATMKWFDINAGSAITMKYPACILTGEQATGITYSIGFATNGQIQDTGAKMIHLAPNTKSLIISKAVSRSKGINQYRGLVRISPKAINSRTNVTCDALLLNKDSYAGTYPVNKIENSQSTVKHEAKISKLDDEALFYLANRGLPEQQARNMITTGFLGDLIPNLPLEFAREFKAMIELVLEV